MQRYFVEGDQMGEEIVNISGDDIKHITRVMRMNIGNEIICSDGSSRTVRCEISAITDDCVEARIVEELKPNTELPVRVTIAQALPKADKLEFIIQKGTELGAIAFIPFQAARSIVKWDEKKSAKKTERLIKIAKEAAEQSYRERIPTISTPFSFRALKEELTSFDAVIVAYEEAAKQGEQSKFRKMLTALSPGASVLIVIGPEGGLTEEEVQSFTDEGASLCGFGPRILRTETAALYALAAISYHFEL